MKHDDSKYYFDEDAAQLAVDFFHTTIVHVKDEYARKPFILEPWQEKIVRDVFGWKRSPNPKYWDKRQYHTRRYRILYVFVPRKNGKSSFAAGLGLKMEMMDFTPGAEVYVAAAGKDQATLVYQIALDMISYSEKLSSRCEPLQSGIWVRSTRSIFRSVSKEVSTKWGLNPSCLIIDEIHAHKNRDLYDSLTSAMGARSQPLTIITTTAGYDKNSIAYEIHQKAIRVRDGLQEDETFYPVIYGAEIDDDWHDEAVWAKANPNLGVSVDLEFLRQEHEDAVRMPGRQNLFRRMYLNQWVEQATRWLDIDLWDSCKDEDIDIDNMPPGSKCFAGLDLSSTRDLTALVFLFPPESEGDTWIVIPRFYMPADNVANRVNDAGVPYDEWVTAGYIKTTPGDIVDYAYIRKDISDLSAKFKIEEIAIDRFNATYLMTQLIDDGFEVVPYSQSQSAMSGPMKEIEKMLLGSEIEHDGNPVMRWMMGNVSPKEDADGRIKPDRSKSAEKIDGVVALLMALGRAIVQENDDTGPSVYESRGILSL